MSYDYMSYNDCVDWYEKIGNQLVRFDSAIEKLVQSRGHGDFIRTLEDMHLMINQVNQQFENYRTENNRQFNDILNEIRLIRDDLKSAHARHDSAE